jgi:two-component system, sensor histidine kinase and response regulator
LFVSILSLYYWRIFSVVRQKAKLESLVQQRTTELREKNLQLDDMNKMNERIFSIIAHDLRSPFNSIMGFTELIARGVHKQDEKFQTRYIGIIQESLKKLLVLMENLLLWSSSQLKGISINPRIYPLSEQVKSNIELIQPAADQKMIHLQFDNSREYRIKADYYMMDAVLRNLLSNAVKFSQPESEIVVSLEQNDHEVICSIKDTGIGMDEDEIGIIFSLDSRKIKTGTRGEQGSGLGLVLCHDFIMRNHGRIWVNSRQGFGSIFSFSVPSADR